MILFTMKHLYNNYDAQIEHALENTCVHAWLSNTVTHTQQMK